MLSIKQISTRKWLPEYDDFTKIALDCRKISYSPYSKFTVGCCLLCENGNIYKGYNIENAAYGVVNCAERTALYSALSNAKKNFFMITVVENDSNTKNSIFCYPYGIWRQALSEFVDNNKLYWYQKQIRMKR